MSAFEDTVRNRMKHQLNQLIAKPEPPETQFEGKAKQELDKRLAKDKEYNPDIPFDRQAKQEWAQTVQDAQRGMEMDQIWKMRRVIRAKNVERYRNREIQKVQAEIRDAAESNSSGLPSYIDVSYSRTPKGRNQRRTQDAINEECRRLGGAIASWKAVEIVRDLRISDDIQTAKRCAWWIKRMINQNVLRGVDK